MHGPRRHDRAETNDSSVLLHHELSMGTALLHLREVHPRQKRLRGHLQTLSDLPMLRAGTVCPKPEAFCLHVTGLCRCHSLKRVPFGIGTSTWMVCALTKWESLDTDDKQGKPGHSQECQIPG